MPDIRAPQRGCRVIGVVGMRGNGRSEAMTLLSDPARASVSDQDQSADEEVGGNGGWY